jgi:hypothetical protein
MSYKRKTSVIDSIINQDPTYLVRFALACSRKILVDRFHLPADPEPFEPRHVGALAQDVDGAIRVTYQKAESVHAKVNANATPDVPAPPGR